MPENKKTQEFLKKLTPCIERGDLDACVEETARVAREMGVGAGELLDLSMQEGMGGKYDFAYLLALAAAQGLEGATKARSYYNAGLAAKYLKKVEKAEEHYKLAIEANPNLSEAHSNYALLLSELNRKPEAEEHYKLAIVANPNLAEAHNNYALLLNELNRKPEAEEHYKLAIVANSNYGEAHFNYANLLDKLNRKEEAEEHYKLAIVANPNYAEAHSNYAILLKELDRKPEAEEHYILAIAANPTLVEAHSNYANLLKKLNRKSEAEKHYKLAIEANPNYAAAHYNYAILLSELNRKFEAEEHYQKAIEANPLYVAALSNYAILLSELDKKTEAEAYYRKVIEADSKDANTHSNYALMLEDLGRKDEAEHQYKMAIDANPNFAGAHYNYANLLSKLSRKSEAKAHYLIAIKANSKDAEAHGAYGLLLIEFNKRKDARRELETAFGIFEEAGQFTKSHLAKAWFYERYSEKYFNMRKFSESGQDAGKAGDEYLKAAETVDGALKDHFSQHGNILKAKSYVRKGPMKYWYTDTLYRFGGKRDISGIIDNLKQAASYYEKAAMCPIEERQDICGACHVSISVFSEILSAMEAIISKRSPEINKKDWITKLEGARRIYEEKRKENGVALVDTLKQLIQCIDEMAVFKEGGLGIQKEKCGRCFGNLIKVSENLDGALNVLAEHGIEVIRDYAKKQGMGGFVSEDKRKSFVDYLITAGKIIGYIIALIVGIIAILQFLQIDTPALDVIKNIFNQTQP